MEVERQGAGKIELEAMGTNILDLNMDSLVQCASSLKVCDLASMAMTCKRMRDAVYADSVWELQCRRRWPPKQMCWGTFQYCGGREAYLARHIASQQFRFQDPIDWQFHRSPAHASHILLQADFITVAQGPSISKWKIQSLTESPTISQTLSDHSARITSMRLLPLAGLATSQSTREGVDTLLVTSSCDHTIRLWGKSHALRTLRGHSGPVMTLANRLLGDQYGSFVLASGGMDGTVRLWDLSSSNKRGCSPLKKTFHGHEQAIRELAVAEYNPSLLVSAAKDLKIRVWDVTASSSSVAGAGALVGSTRCPGVPVGLTCEEAICYVAGGSDFMAVDLRSMQTVATIAAHDSGILTFAVSASGQAVCTGGLDKTAKLWDLRSTREPYAALGNHNGPVHCVHIDSYKVVTGGFADRHVYVWDVKTGAEISTCDSLKDADPSNVGVSAMAVSGARIATATCGDIPGVMRLRDYSNCAVPLTQAVSEPGSEAGNKLSSKFWETSFGEDV